jgi:hypothetical protein
MADAPGWRRAVDRHGVEDDEHQDQGDRQQLATASRTGTRSRNGSLADEQAEEPDRGSV